MRRAYLLVAIDTTLDPPAVVGAGIFSEGATSLTRTNRSRVPAEIVSMAGATYAEAKERVLAYVRSTSDLAWLRRWLAPPRGGDCA